MNELVGVTVFVWVLAFVVRHWPKRELTNAQVDARFVQMMRQLNHDARQIGRAHV